MCGIWDPAVEFDSAVQVAANFDCWVGQVEGPNQYDRCLQNIDPLRQAHPVPYPAAIVTNFGGLGTADLAKPFIDAELFCITEAHIGEGDVVDKTEDRLAYAANVLKWPGPQPMAGLGGGVSLSQYTTLKQHSGWSAFAAEELLT